MNKLLALSAALTVTLAPFASRAEPGHHAEKAEKGEKGAEHEAAEEKEPSVEVELEDVTGMATLRATEERAAVHAHVHSLEIGARYALSEHYALRAFVPFAFGYLTERGEQTTETTFGNVSLAVDRTSMVSRHTHLGYQLMLSAPTALGDPGSDKDEDERHAMFNGLAAAVRGLEEDELYFSKRASVVPRFDVKHGHGRWNLGFFAKVPLLFRTGGVTPTNHERHVNSVAIDGVIGAQATYAVHGEMESTEGWAVASGARVVMDYFFREPIEEPEEKGLPPEQFFGESMLMARVGAVKARMGLLVPFGGRLLDAHEHVHAWRFSIAWMH